MARAISLKQFSYILEEDRKKETPPNERTVFTLRRLSADENAQIENYVTADYFDEEAKETGDGKKKVEKVSMSMVRGKIVVETLRIGLIGWSNLLTDDGEGTIEFVEPKSGNMCPKENINILSPDHRHELCNAIENGAIVEEEVAKNSE